MTLFVSATLAVLMCLQGCSSAAGPEKRADSPVAGEGDGSAPMVDLVFAANFSSNGDCRLGIASSACDLFVARLNILDGTVSDVAQVTFADGGESFPAWNPARDVVYFSSESGGSTSLGYVDTRTKSTGTLANNAKQPDVAADGTIVYETLAGHRIMTARLGADGTSLAGVTMLTNVALQLEPRISADAKRVVFYQEIEGGEPGTSRGRLYDVTTGQTAELSAADGSAHCTITGAGDLATCQNIHQGGIIGRALDSSGAVGAAFVFLSPVAPDKMATVDKAYAVCTGVTLDYVTFCPDRDHVVATAQCGVDKPQPHGGNTVFSRLVLVDLSSEAPVYRPIGERLAAAFAGPGSDSFTARCR